MMIFGNGSIAELAESVGLAPVTQVREGAARFVPRSRDCYGR